MPVNCSAAEAISDDEGESLPDTNHSCTSAKTIAMVNESGITFGIKLIHEAGIGRAEAWQSPGPGG
jgi:hypothetical protein